MSAKLVSIINMKGGVGKTTLGFNLAMYLVEIKKKKVLLIDLDPQANATIVSTDPAKYELHCKSKKTVADIFVAAHRTYGPVHAKPKPFPAFEEFIYEVIGGKQGQFHIIPSELILSSVLRGMTLGPFDLDKLITDDVKKRYDYIFIDCAPTYSSLTTVALNTTRAVLIPMIAETFGAHGTSLMKQVLDEHKYDFGFEVKVVGVAFTMWEDQTDQFSHSNNIVTKWPPGTVFRSKISKNNWYRVSNGKRETIWHSKAHQKTKDEFEDFVTEFEAKV